MLTLHTFYPAMGNHSASPFCVKAMVLLNIADVEWTPHWTQDLNKYVYKKLPVIEAPDGMINDSNLLIDWLEEQGKDVFPGLDAKTRATARAVIRMTEQNLTEGLVYNRWLIDDCWTVLNRQVFGGLPAPLKLFVPNMVRKTIRQRMDLSGMGRFSEKDRMTYLSRDLETIAAFIDDAFLFGTTPTAADAAVAPVLSMIDTLPADTALRRRLRGDDKLMAYVGRAREQLFAQLPVLGANRASAA